MAVLELRAVGDRRPAVHVESLSIGITADPDQRTKMADHQLYRWNGRAGLDVAFTSSQIGIGVVFRAYDAT